MPKRRGNSGETIDVYVRVSAAHAELLDDLRAIPPKARAGRLRLLATLALRPSGPPTTGISPPSPAPEAPANPVPEAPAPHSVTPQRQRVSHLKGRLLP